MFGAVQDNLLYEESPEVAVELPQQEEGRMPPSETVTEQPQEPLQAAPASHRSISMLFSLPLPAPPTTHAEPPAHPYLGSGVDRAPTADTVGTSGATDEGGGARRRKRGPRPSSERTPRTPEERQARHERREARRAEREAAVTTLLHEEKQPQPQHPTETAPATALYFDAHGASASAPAVDRLAAAQQFYKGLQVRSLPLGRIWPVCPRYRRTSAQVRA